jgi:PAS domain S-box-containing protein
LVCIALCLAILVFDANTPPGYAEWMLYLLPISLAFWRLRQRQVAYVASLSILFLGLGVVVSPPGAIPWEITFFNRVVGAIVISLTAFAFVQFQRMNQAQRESEEKYRAIVENSQDFIGILQDGVLKYVNRAATRRLGWTYEELVSPSFDPIEKVVSERFRGLIKENVGKRLRGEDAPPYEVSLVTRDGSEIPVILRAAQIVYRGRPAIEFAFSDISERKLMETELSRSNQFLGSVIENAYVWLNVLDNEQNVLVWNKAAEAMSGYSPGEVVGHEKIWEWLYPDQEYRKQITETVNDMLQSGRTDVDVETKIKRKDGQTRIISWNERALTDQDGKAIGTIAIGHDITERKKMEEALRENEERFRRVFEEGPLGMALLSLDYHSVRVNETLCRMLGYSQHELTGLKFTDITHPEDMREGVELTEKMRRGEIPRFSIEKRYIKRNGDILSGSLTASYIRDAEGNPVYSIAIIEDITQRKAMEEQLKQYAEGLEQMVDTRTQQLHESERRFRDFADLLPQIAFETDEKGNFTFVNRASYASTGYSQEDVKKGLNALHVIVSEEQDRAAEDIGRVLNGKRLAPHEYLVRRRDGSTFPVMLDAGPLIREDKIVGVRGVAMDITELKKMQQRLTESERLAAIGEAAAMVGHDLRNPLQGIAGALYLLKQESFKERSEMLRLIQNNVEYADAIVRDLSDYSTEMQLNLAETTPKSIAGDAIRLLKVPQNITVQDLSEDQPILRVDHKRMRRVFINFVENAFESMPEGGTVTITSRQWNNAAEIAISDTGSGMPAKMMENLWKPLQTTKAKGMGLGLAICKRVVDAHGGTISVKSEVGEGTTVTIRLPLQPAIAEVKQK